MKPKDMMRRVVWFDEWQLEQIESWLAAMALRGWRLERMGLRIATFRRCQPASLRYRLDVNPDSKFSRGQRQAIYRSAGWVYIAARQDIMIFCTADPAAQEIHTDPVLYAPVYRRLSGFNNLYAILYLVIAVMMLVPVSLDPAYQLKQFLLGSGIISLFAGIMFLFAAVRQLVCHFQVTARAKRMERGTLPRHDVPYRGALLRHKVVNQVLAIALGAFLLAMVFELAMGFTRFIPRPIPEGRLAVVRAADLDDSFRMEEGMILDSELSYHVSWSVLVPEQVILAEHGNIDRKADPSKPGGQIWLESEKYRNWTPWMAWLVAKSLADTSQTVVLPDAGWAPLPRASDTHGFDDLWLYDNTGEGRHELVARQGCVVYRLSADGPYTTDELLAALAEWIGEGE